MCVYVYVCAFLWSCMSVWCSLRLALTMCSCVCVHVYVSLFVCVCQFVHSACVCVWGFSCSAFVVCASVCVYLFMQALCLCVCLLSTCWLSYLPISLLCPDQYSHSPLLLPLMGNLALLAWHLAYSLFSCHGYPILWIAPLLCWPCCRRYRCLNC